MNGTSQKSGRLERQERTAGQARTASLIRRPILRARVYAGRLAVLKKTTTTMCRRVTCPNDGKPTWWGCGELVLLKSFGDAD